ncbi:hypothetical protein [Kingella potus]|uniref:hypothetical protein n=1 Tax=Kingella potus TaxID=265175 RepID=UPI001FD05E04|nr:hypothetical protein [Kingella potus]UOP00508.1 hypothetical protein LVJ84_11790 [Kingella potus]
MAAPHTLHRPSARKQVKRPSEKRIFPFSDGLCCESRVYRAATHAVGRCRRQALEIKNHYFVLLHIA